MANKFLLVANTTSNRIEELAAGDNLDLTSNGIFIDNNTGINGYVLMSDGTKVKWAPVGNVVASGTQQLTNKVIDCTNNTVINIPNSSLVNKTITINGQAINLGGSISNLSTPDAAETLTNKIINASNNTLSNIPNSALVNNTITINGEQVALGSGIVIQQLYANVVASGVQTLTNKTMDGSQNTFVNIPNSALVNDYIKINNVDTYLGDTITVGDITATGSGVFENKTIDGSLNNLSNISVNSLSTKSITFDGAAYDLGSAYNLNITTASGVQVLTNKTINGNDNILSNIPNTALVNNSFFINGTSVELGTSAFVGDVTTSGNAVLTNKTIDATQNNVINITNGSLTSNGVIIIDGQEVKLGDYYIVNRKKTTGTLTTNLGSSPSLSSDDTIGAGAQVLLGKTNTSITSWNFTFPYASTSSGWTAMYEILVDGNPSYTYGSSFSVPGAGTGTIKWAGGSAPSAVSGLTLFEFRVIKDTSNGVTVLGKGTTYS